MAHQPTDATTIRPDSGARHARKYETRNPVQQWLLARFHRRVRAWLDELRPARVFDFGCGEAYFWMAQKQLGPLPEVVGVDLRAEAIAQASERLPELRFEQRDLFSYGPEAGRFDLVIASEVLEHLYDPDRVLAKLCQLSSGSLLLTVPHEPFFRLSNLARGRDILRLGNHPEHVQLWSRRSFARFASRHLEIDRLETSFPFILLLGRPRVR